LKRASWESVKEATINPLGRLFDRIIGRVNIRLREFNAENFFQHYPALPGGPKAGPFPDP
jgi:hypothetical protein